jgi:hypothetical protein
VRSGRIGVTVTQPPAPIAASDDGAAEVLEVRCCSQKNCRREG